MGTRNIAGGDDAHKVYPKQFARDDFWSQIKRTVNGEPVSEEDIAMIVDQIGRHLALEGGGRLLDLGCGNAALASRLFPRLEGYTGVDFSEYLLGVAREYFSEEGKTEYFEQDALSFAQGCAAPERFDKALCYGCMSYLSREDLLALLSAFSERFEGLTRVFFGNVPDRARAPEFFARREVTDYDLDDPTSPIGVWWDPEELRGAARERGFEAEVVRMPAAFYGATYRFDLSLSRPGHGAARG